MLDASFSSANNGVVLAASPCRTGWCAKFLITADAGRHFETVVADAIAAPAPAPSSGAPCPAGRLCVSRVVMMNAEHGFAFNPSLTETIDGGHTWRTMTGDVSDLAATARVVFRFEHQPSGGAGAPSTLQRRAPAGGSWSDVAVVPPERNYPPQLLAGAPNMVALVGYGNPAGSVPRASITLSADGGWRWHQVDDVCPGDDGYVSSVAVAAPDRVVELCGHQLSPPGVPQGVTLAVSDDGGGHFIHHLVPETRAVDSPSIDVVALGRRILVDEHGPHGDDIELSTDDGARWKDVAQTDPAQDSSLLIPSGPRTATVVQLGSSGIVVWTSRDEGSTWSSLRRPGSSGGSAAS